jgi:hypothetical protein
MPGLFLGRSGKFSADAGDLHHRVQQAEGEILAHWAGENILTLFYKWQPPDWIKYMQYKTEANNLVFRQSGTVQDQNLVPWKQFVFNFGYHLRFYKKRVIVQNKSSWLQRNHFYNIWTLHLFTV